MRELLAAALLGMLALPVRADIVDSGSLTIGGQGVIGGTLTVQGNALGVAGSVSAASTTLSGSGAQVYSLTTSSGIHIVNGKIKLDVGAMIQWADLTITSTSVSGLSTAHNSSSTIFADTSFNQTSFGVCFATVVITTGGQGRIRIGASGMWQSSYGNYSALNVLQDGQFVAPYSSSLGIQAMQGTYGGASVSLGVNFLLPAPSAGQHSYCLTGRSASGSASVAMQCDSVGYDKCQFVASEEL